MEKVTEPALGKSQDNAIVKKGPLEYIAGDTIWRDNSVSGEIFISPRWIVYSKKNKQIIFETDYAAYVPLEEREEFISKYNKINARLRKQSEERSTAKTHEVDLEAISKSDVLGLIPTAGNYAKIGGAMIGLSVNGKKIRSFYANPVSDFNHSSVSYIQKLMKVGNGSNGLSSAGNTAKVDKPLASDDLGFAPEIKEMTKEEVEEARKSEEYGLQLKEVDLTRHSQNISNVKPVPEKSKK